jgi:hypothetical protein
MLVYRLDVKIPTGILTSIEGNVNPKTTICISNIPPEQISINDLLENINILIKYIISQRGKKNKKIKNMRRLLCHYLVARQLIT